MKKVTKDELIELLKNKACSYQELSKLTGYHPKSLIRINSMIKNGTYKTSIKNSMVIKDFLNSTYKTYRGFYEANKNKYNVSYSMICRILKNTHLNKEILLIKKIKKKEKTHFIVIDYKTKSLLFKFNSTRNDTKSIKEILFRVLNNYGSPSNICFINLDISKEIINILQKYSINIIESSKPISSMFKELLLDQHITYNNCSIDLRDFYNVIKRKTIDINTIQFNNVRYKIISDNNIPKNTKIYLYYNNQKSDMFIMINNQIYDLYPYINLSSKKGLTKY